MCYGRKWFHYKCVNFNVSNNNENVVFIYDACRTLQSHMQQPATAPMHVAAAPAVAVAAAAPMDVEPPAQDKRAQKRQRAIVRSKQQEKRSAKRQKQRDADEEQYAPPTSNRNRSRA